MRNVYASECLATSCMHSNDTSTTCAVLASARAVSEAALLWTSPCMDLASAIVASATLRVHQVSSATRPTPDIVLSVTHSASYTQCCVTDTPSSNHDLCGPGDTERVRVIVRHRSNAELGALDDRVAELPCNCPVWHADDAVSSNAVLAAYCELE